MARTTPPASTGREQTEGRDRARGSDAKSERLGARLTRRQKEMLQRAADLTGRSLTDFIIGSALDRAAEAIRDFEVIELSARDARAFFEALQNPPGLDEKLYEAIRSHRDEVDMRW